MKSSAVKYAIFATAWGDAGLLWTEKGVCGLCLPGPSRKELAQRLRRDHPGAVLSDAREMEPVVREVRAYFAGEKARFRARLDLSWASPFAQSVYAALLRIPPGETRSYGEVARAAGKPAASRAVGQANAANRIPLIIPCHRVVCADGSLGGFSGPGGPRMKKRMLDLEKKCNRGASRPSIQPKKGGNEDAGL